MRQYRIHRLHTVSNLYETAMTHAPAMPVDYSATVTCSGNCSCNQSSGTFSGTISDGIGSYSNSESCRWLICSVSEMVSEISLSLTFLSTESGYDYVTINRYQSSSCSTVVQVARLSGSSFNSNTTYTSSTGYLQVLFTSDGSRIGSGFDAVWSISTADCVARRWLCACSVGFRKTLSLFGWLALFVLHSHGHASGGKAGG